MTVADEKILRDVSLFKNFSSEDVRAIASVAVEMTYEPGTTIFSENEPGDDFFIILSGEVEIVKDTPMGGRQMLAVLEPGSFFGEMSILDGSPRSATAVAGDMPVELLNIKKEYLEVLASRNMKLVCSLLMVIIRHVSERLRLTSEHLLFSQRALKGFDL